MAATESLRDHLVEELNDLIDAEQQLIIALPQMVEKSSARELKAAFRGHLAETREHVKRNTHALKLLGETSIGKACEAMQGLIEEGQDLMNGSENSALLDAMLITAAQKIEHYEIASYGTVRTYAQVLGERGVARLMAQTLKEEKAADRTLTSIAERSVNARAAREWHAESGLEAISAGWVGASVSGAMKKIMRTQAADRAPRKRARKTR
jgi:ferritin-like metal-binding protein YciE